MAILGNQPRFNVMSFNQELSVNLVRITTGATAVDPDVTVNGGGLVLNCDLDATGSIVMTLHPEFVILAAFANVQSTGDVTVNCDATVDGNAATNSVSLTTLSSASASNLTSKVIDVLLVGTRRTEAATGGAMGS